MKSLLLRLVLVFLGASIVRAEPIGVGTTEAKLLEAKGPPESRATAGRKVIYRWKDMQVVLVDGKVDQVQARSPGTEKKAPTNPAKALQGKTPVNRNGKMSGASPGAPSNGTPGPMMLQPGEDAASINEKKEARREVLSQEIAIYQATMDRFDKQSAFKKPPLGQVPVTRAEYERAKAERDKRQKERDELAR